MATGNEVPPPRTNGFPSLETYQGYFRKVAVHVKPELRDRQWLSDVVQEAMLQVHKIKHQFEGQTEQEWRGFLRTIVRRVAMSFRPSRPRGRQVIIHSLEQSATAIQYEPSDGQPSPSSMASRNERIKLLNDAISELPDATKSVVTDILFYGLRNVDVAERRGLTNGMVSGRVRRAVEVIRKRLDERGGE